jgi:hypothetical protein
MFGVLSNLYNVFTMNRGILVEITIRVFNAMLLDEID